MGMAGATIDGGVSGSVTCHSDGGGGSIDGGRSLFDLVIVSILSMKRMSV